MAQTFRVTLPDGTVATRTSESRTYTHAVMVTQDNHARADRLNREADETAAAYQVYTEIVESGELHRLRRVVSTVNGFGDCFYASTIPGYEHLATIWLPDWQDPESWQKYAEGAAESIRVRPERLRREAADLRAEPRYSYGVWRWSASAANAAKGAREFSRLPDTTTTIVPVDPT